MCNIRASDIQRFVGRARWSLWAPLLATLPAVNVLMLWVVNFACGYEDEWFVAAKKLGLLGVDRGTFLERATEISRLAKNNQLLSPYPNYWFEELPTASGYRFEGEETKEEFSSREEMLALVKSKDDWPNWLVRMYKDVGTRFKYRGKKMLPLPEWFDKLSWSTTGGAALSGLDKVKIEVNGEDVKVRLTKNVIPWCAGSREEIIEAVESSFGREESTVEVKSETAKLRNIYNFSVYNFIGLFWVLDHITEKNFDGTSLGENFDEEMARYETFQDRTRRLISLPIDWAKFDRQVKTWQVKEFWDNVYEATSCSEDVSSKIDDGLENSWVKDPETGEWVLVENGLLSGKPETSMLGGRVNRISCQVAADIFEAITGRKVPAIEVRGDDAAIWFENYMDAALYYALFCAVGDANPAKFRAGKEMEFLRNKFNGQKVSGILIRCLVGITQRKPIASEQPAVKMAKVARMIEQLSTAQRRGSNVQLTNFVMSVKDFIERDESLVGYMGSLKANGGNGIGEVETKVWAYDNSLELKGFSTKWAEDIEMQRLSKYRLTRSEASKLASDTIASIVATSDDFEVKRILRDRKCRLVRQEKAMKAVEITSASRLKEDAISFGVAKSIKAEVAEAKRVARVRGLGLTAVLSPGSMRAIKGVEKRFKMSRADAISWLCGEISCNMLRCHPKISDKVYSLTACSVVDSGKSVTPLLVAVTAERVSALLQRRFSHLLSW